MRRVQLWARDAKTQAASGVGPAQPAWAWPMGALAIGLLAMPVIEPVAMPGFCDHESFPALPPRPAVAPHCHVGRPT